LAAAKHLMSVRLDRESVSVGNLVLEPFDFRAQELENRAAFCTDHVVVMGMKKFVLEASEAVSELDRLGELRVHEDFQGTVNRRSPYTGILSANDAIEIIHGHVTARIEKMSQHDDPLLRVFHTVLG
jgi:hypothetical protein